MIAKLGRTECGLIDHKTAFKRGRDCGVNLPAVGTFNTMRYGKMPALSCFHIFIGMSVARCDYICLFIFCDLSQYVRDDRNCFGSAERAVDEIGLHINYKQQFSHFAPQMNFRISSTVSAIYFAPAPSSSSLPP